MKNKHSILISLTDENIPLYEEYISIVKTKKHVNVMWHNMDMFINGMKDTIKNAKKEK